MKPVFPENSRFLEVDTRGGRWAIPYNFECLNARVENLLGRHQESIQGKRILDLASHIGTFSYAALALGANFVHGVDTEEKTIQLGGKLFAEHKVPESSYRFEVGDAFEVLEKTPEGQYDTILCFGMLYYTAEPYRLLKLMRDKAGECVLLDTFTAGYAVIQGKDALKIYPRVNDETLELPMALTSMTQAEKKDYRLPESFKHKGKDLSLTTFPTKALLEIWFESLGMKFKILDWSAYAKRKCAWRDLWTPEQKKSSHWADVYASGVRVSYRLERR